MQAAIWTEAEQLVSAKCQEKFDAWFSQFRQWLNSKKMRLCLCGPLFCGTYPLFENNRNKMVVLHE
jgi:hypothetical protein